MATQLLLWSVKAWGDREEVKKAIRKYQRIMKNIDKGYYDDWSCCKDAKPGDRFFMLMMGEEPRGIIASGWIASESYKREHWRERGKKDIYADILFDTLLDPFGEEENILHIDVLERKIPNVKWKYCQRPRHLREDIAEALEREWRGFLKKIGKLDEKRIEECRKKALEIGSKSKKKVIEERRGEREKKREGSREGRKNQPVLLPDEEEVENVFRKIKRGRIKKYLEGAVIRVTVNAVERDKKARDECIKYYGTKCYVCGFDFEKVYGEIGKGFIHVHHLKPMKEIAEWYKRHKKKYEVNPKEDLRPVCPNCHAMLHRREPPFTIEELREIIKKNSERV